MPLTNDDLFGYSTQMTAISGTANVAAAGFSVPAEATSLSSTNHFDYPAADAVLYASFSTSVSSASNYVQLYRRELNIDSTNDAPQPQSAAPAYSNTYVGAFIIPPFTATSAGYFAMPDVPLAEQCEFYIENKTNATIISGYTVKLRPKTQKPAA